MSHARCARVFFNFLVDGTVHHTSMLSTRLDSVHVMHGYTCTCIIVMCYIINVHVYLNSFLVSGTYLKLQLPYWRTDSRDMTLKQYMQDRDWYV